MVTVSKKGTGHLWDVQTGKEYAVLRGHNGRVCDATFSPDGTQVVTVGTDGTARIWQARPGSDIDPRARAFFCAVSPDGSRVLMRRYRDPVTRLNNLVTGEVFDCLAGRATNCYYACFSHDGKRAVIFNDPSDTLWVVDGYTSKQLAVIRQPQQASFDADISPDGKWMATANHSNAIIWDLATGKKRFVLPSSRLHAIDSTRFSPDGRWLVTRSSGPNGGVAGGPIAILWNVATGKKAQVLKWPEPWRRGGASARWVEFTRDSRRLLIACGGTASLWDVAKGRLLIEFKGHKWNVGHVSFAATEQRIITASGDRTVRLWDVASGKQLAVFKGHEGGVRRAKFSPNGKWLLTIGRDKTTRLWDVASGREIATFKEAYGFGRYTTFSPDSRSLLRLTPYGAPEFFAIDILSLARQSKPRELTAQERERFFLAQ